MSYPYTNENPYCDACRADFGVAEVKPVELKAVLDQHQKIQKRGNSFEVSLTKGIAKGPPSPRWLVFRCLDLREHHSDGDDVS